MCTKCKEATPIDITLVTGKGPEIYCPNHLLFAMFEKEVELSPDMTLTCEITGQKGAIKYESGQEIYILAPAIMERLLCRNLKKPEWECLAEKHGEHQFMLHSDFYYDGLALNPVKLKHSICSENIQRTDTFNERQYSMENKKFKKVLCVNDYVEDGHCYWKANKIYDVVEALDGNNFVLTTEFDSQEGRVGPHYANPVNENFVFLIDTPELFADLYQDWAYAITGAGGDLHDWTEGYNKLLTKNDIGKPIYYCTFQGEFINELLQLTGDNRFQPDVTFLCFPLDELETNKLSIFKLACSDRWLPDIVDNTLRREDKVFDTKTGSYKSAQLDDQDREL